MPQNAQKWADVSASLTQPNPFVLPEVPAWTTLEALSPTYAYNRPDIGNSTGKLEKLQ